MNPANRLSCLLVALLLLILGGTIGLTPPSAARARPGGPFQGTPTPTATPTPLPLCTVPTATPYPTPSPYPTQPPQVFCSPLASPTPYPTSTPYPCPLCPTGTSTPTPSVTAPATVTPSSTTTPTATETPVALCTIPTTTPNPTYTPRPTYTPAPTIIPPTCPPTYPIQPSYTPQPTYTPTPSVTGTATPPTATPTWVPTTTCCYASGSATTTCTLLDTYSYDVTLTNPTPHCSIGVCGPVDLYFQVASNPDPFGHWTTIDHAFAGNVCLGSARLQGTFYEPSIPPPNVYYRIWWEMTYTNCLGRWSSDGYSDPAALCPAPTATPLPCTSSFSDVRPADYFYAPVQYLACHGVVSGYADGSFRPYNPTTRAQMIKIVVLGFALPVQTPPGGLYTFADVPPAQPFYPYVETAAWQIVGGYTCGGPGEPCDDQHRPYFRPNANVTRGQLSKIVVGAASWPPINPATATFADVAPGSPFYAFVETAACHGIVSGYACGGPGEPCDDQHRPYFRQYNTATRGQIAKIVYGALTAGGGCPSR